MSDITNETRQPADAPACLCVSCTCSDCHVACYGHCNGCGSPVTSCNSYQTEGCKWPVPESDAAAFDYSGLDGQTLEYLHIAEQEYAQGKVWAERGLRRMANGVAIAHEALCGGGVVARCDNSKHGNRGEATFRSWCKSLGISKDTAYRLLQVSALYDKSSPEEQELLAEAPTKLLYAAARPSAPAELVAGVKNGDITTHKQYQELLAELKAKEDELKRKDDILQKTQQLAYEQKIRAENAVAAMSSSDQMQNVWRGRAERAAQENEANLARIAELEARPIDATAATEEDIARWRAEGAAEAAAKAKADIDSYIAEAQVAHNVYMETEDKLKAAKREAKRLRETLDGRTAHLDAVEAELAALKAKLSKAQKALPRMDEPPAPLPSPSARPALVLCRECIFEPICCGVQLMDEEQLSEAMAAGFGSALDEDAFDRRLLGCTAGLTNQESR